MASLTVNDYAARAAACERCASHVESLDHSDPHDRLAGGWLAKKLRAEADTWRALSRPAAPVLVPCVQPVASRENGKAARPLTERMVEALRDMSRGATVKSEVFFSWPRWDTRVPHSPCSSPTRAMLEGMDARGLLAVERIGRVWITRINQAGVKAIEDYAAALRVKKPSHFKEYGTSYAVTDSRGTHRVGGPRVRARTEKEVIGKVKAWLKGRHIGEQVSDIRIDWKPGDA